MDSFRIAVVSMHNVPLNSIRFHYSKMTGTQWFDLMRDDKESVIPGGVISDVILQESFHELQLVVVKSKISIWNEFNRVVFY